MIRELALHPDSRCAALIRIEIEATRSDDATLSLRYLVIGNIGDLRLPVTHAPQRARDLWKHTCFEAFLRIGGGYCEFHFAPSPEWAAYRFDRYRAGMRELSEIAAPAIDVRSDASMLDVLVSLQLSHMQGLQPDAAWTLGLSAVIEETDGRLSYWALAHPRGRPDFHHSNSFALELPPPLESPSMARS